MIRFSCTCGHPFELPENQAGTSLQCPNCGLLVDVPTLTELAALSDDGTYKMEGVDDVNDPNRLASLQRTFSKSRFDEYGREIDLRPTFDDLANVGVPEELELADVPENRPSAPKYDPITGELIRPIEIKESAPPATAVPVAGALVGYGRRRPSDAPFQASMIIPSMFHFANFVVIGVVFIMHIFLQMMLMPVMAGLFLIVPPFLLLCGLFLSHYACVVDDIATENRDELPRPLRDLGWHNDLWGPFVHFAAALMLSYGAMVSALYMPRFIGLAMVLATVVAGTIAFPAVFLTMTTSGSVINLSPDRLLRVARTIGPAYALCVIYWLGASGLYFLGMVGTSLSLMKLFLQPGAMPWYLSPPMAISYPLLLIAVIAMHGFCWYLGLQYREHHADFGWAYQFHARKAEVPRRRGFALSPKSRQPAVVLPPRTPSEPLPVIPVVKPRE